MQVVRLPGPGPLSRGGATINLLNYLPTADPGAVDYAPYLQAACDAVPAQGGSVYIPASIRPVLGVASSITPKPGTRILSDHPAALRLIKLADVPIFDVSGAGASADGTSSRRNIHFEQLTLAGAENDTGSPGGTGAGGYGNTPNPAWNQPLVKAFYAQFIHFTDVRFRNNYGCGIHGVQWWDSYLTRCRFDFLGKGDGTRPAVWAARLVQGTSVGQFGYSGDNTNNIWITDCVGEQNRDGVLWIDGRDENGANTPGAPSNNRCYVSNLKCESVFDIYAGHIRVDQARFISFRNLDCVVKGAPTPQDIVACRNVEGLTVDNFTLELKEITGSNVGVKNGILFGSITGLDFRGGRATAQTINKPTTSFLSVDGNCSGVIIDPWRYIANPGGAPLTSIDAATWAYRNSGRGVGVATAPLGSSLGAVTRKVAVADVTGTVIGYFPVYDTIT